MGFSWVQINVQSNIQQSAMDMVVTECKKVMHAHVMACKIKAGLECRETLFVSNNAQ